MVGIIGTREVQPLIGVDAGTEIVQLCAIAEHLLNATIAEVDVKCEEKGQQQHIHNEQQRA